MAVLLFVGCLFLAYGPSLVILLGFIVQKSYLFIATITRCARGLSRRASLPTAVVPQGGSFKKMGIVFE